MTKQPQNHGQEWTKAQERRMAELAEHNTPTRLMARDLGRSVAAVRSHASEIGISLKPTNQSPYGRARR